MRSSRKKPLEAEFAGIQCVTLIRQSADIEMPTRLSAHDNRFPMIMIFVVSFIVFLLLQISVLIFILSSSHST